MSGPTATTCVQTGVTLDRTNQATTRAATLAHEAHSWGLDRAAWRAHLNPLTWPEVLRQLALAAGWGPRRCRPAKATHRHGEFALGEDVIAAPDGTLTHRWPTRFTANPAMGDYTVKEACWKVLTRARLLLHRGYHCLTLACLIACMLHSKTAGRPTATK